MSGRAQVSVLDHATFARLIELRVWLSFVEPRPTARPSVKASSCLWQLAHDCVWLSDSLLS
jgi:hypothetical protein